MGRPGEVTSDIGIGSGPLGLFRCAPETVAREKLVEMAQAADRLAKPRAIQLGSASEMRDRCARRWKALNGEQCWNAADD